MIRDADCSRHHWRHCPRRGDTGEWFGRHPTASHCTCYGCRGLTGRLDDPVQPEDPRDEFDLPAEIVGAPETEEEVHARIDRLRTCLEGIAAWGPYEPDPVKVAEGRRTIREFWGDRYRPVCNCVSGPDGDIRCERCGGAR
jgi:hypothetical protein